MNSSAERLQSRKVSGVSKMPKLPMRTQTTHYINDRDLENYVFAVYGKGRNLQFEVAAGEEASNGTNLVVNVSDLMPTYWERDANRFLEGAWLSSPTAIVLHLLCRDGYIKPGTYCVQVSW
jgi:hypothetical protein